MNEHHEDVCFAVNKILEIVSQEDYDDKQSTGLENHPNDSTNSEEDLDKTITDAINRYELLYEEIEKRLKDACSQTNSEIISKKDRQCQCDLERGGPFPKKIKIDDGEEEKSRDSGKWQTTIGTLKESKTISRPSTGLVFILKRQQQLAYVLDSRNVTELNTERLLKLQSTFKESTLFCIVCSSQRQIIS